MKEEAYVSYLRACMQSVFPRLRFEHSLSGLYSSIDIADLDLPFRISHDKHND